MYGNGFKFIASGQKNIDDVRVELAAAPFMHDFAYCGEREGLFVNPFGDQRVKNVSHCHQPGGERDVVTGQAIVIDGGWML